ncbi:MAG: hypothetical protein A2W91_20555 [Bacteroidetes bacterium GWF2_38_335]|nr:MAG: hypothetical protein A2W91_20555 [Bacteroidetes bacterium GWF2_38_335]OFY79455.1 MAG: hypothetical protein A2281_13530 [Bacteroidetes bacterium RIFOXYA12_FULL_38_20]HBS86611.1 hypothetical protein [Bacteroidales bacterium]
MKYLLILTVISLLFSSCRILNSNVMFETDPGKELTSFDSTAIEYIIKPNDKIDLKVYTNKGEKLIDISGTQMLQQSSLTYLVEFDGMVKIPTLGRIPIAGKTIRQAEEMLEAAYKEYFQDPFVFLKVTNRRVLVFPEGSTNATIVEISEENFTLIEAIASAGGISDYSKSHRIKLLRGSLNDPKVYLFNVSNLKEMQKANFVLQANDIIYIEARPKYASRLLLEITPYLNLVTTGLLIYSLFK